MPEAISKLFAAIQQSIKSHKWWWAGGGGAVIVAIVAVVVVFGGFFGPSGKAICTATLERARDYGVVPYNAALANNDAKSTDVKDRRLCLAVADSDTYDMTVDLKCKKMTDKACIELYAVARSDGLSTYQLREETDAEKAAEAADSAQADAAIAAASAAAPPSAPAEGSSPVGGDVAVDNGAASAPGNSQSPPQ